MRKEVKSMRGSEGLLAEVMDDILRISVLGFIIFSHIVLFILHVALFPHIKNRNDNAKSILTN